MLHSHFSNSILHLELDGGDRFNPLSLQLARELKASLNVTGIEGVLLTAKGRAFCAGGNLRDYQNMQSPDQGLAVNREIAEILEFIDNLSIPTACYVQGLALGGGVELISCFQFIGASPQSLFGLWQRRQGLSFGWGGGERLARRVSKPLLSQWVLTADTLNAYQAKEMGLVDQITLRRKGSEVCKSWIEKVREFGFSEAHTILQSGVVNNRAINELWMKPRHQKALKSF